MGIWLFRRICIATLASELHMRKFYSPIVWDTTLNLLDAAGIGQRLPSSVIGLSADIHLANQQNFPFSASCT
jgi:hypothetical protein